MHDVSQNDLEESQEHQQRDGELESEQKLVETLSAQLEEEKNK